MITKRFYTKGSKELCDFFEINGVNHLVGDDENRAYYFNSESKIFEFVPLRVVDTNHWEYLSFYEFAKAINNDYHSYFPNNKSKVVNSHSFDTPANNQVAAESKLKDVLSIQIGGNHYSGASIQPIEYIRANKLGFIEGCIVKYISRYKKKNGKEDLLKVIQNAQMLLADEYGVVVEFKVKE